jgi:hypothetical protein
VVEGTLVKDITGDKCCNLCEIFPADVCFWNAWGCTLCSLPKNQVMWWMRLSWRSSTSHHPNRHPQCMRDLKKARHPELHCLMEVTLIIKRYSLQMILLVSFPCLSINNSPVIGCFLDADNEGIWWATVFH